MTTHDVTTLDGVIALYDHAFDEVYAAAARLTRGDRAAAEDLVQDAFVQLVRAARTGRLDAVGVGWLVTTVRRRFIDRLRSAEREERRLRLVTAGGADDADLAAEPREPSMLDGLSDRERTALVLRYVDDLPVGEVAELMSTSVRATESLLQRAKQKARAGRSVS